MKPSSLNNIQSIKVDKSPSYPNIHINKSSLMPSSGSELTLATDVECFWLSGTAPPAQPGPAAAGSADGGVSRSGSASGSGLLQSFDSGALPLTSHPTWQQQGAALNPVFAMTALTLRAEPVVQQQG